MIERRIWFQNMGRIFHQIMQEFTFFGGIRRGSMIIVHRSATWMGKAVFHTGHF